MSTYKVTKTRNGHRFGQTIASGFSTIEEARRELWNKFQIHLHEKCHYIEYGDIIETLESGEEIRESRPSGWYEDANPSDSPTYEWNETEVGSIEDWNKAEHNSWYWDVWKYAIEEVEESED